MIYYIVFCLKAILYTYDGDYMESLEIENEELKREVKVLEAEITKLKSELESLKTLLFYFKEVFR